MIIAVAMVFVIVTAIQFGVYSQRTLGGNIDHFMLPAKMFGVPEDLEKRGVTVLFEGEKQTGWDGQFYYYMSNDLLAQKDTAEHIDASAYRYQRIGLSLYVAIVAKLTGQDWVSPKTFLFSYFALILAATLVGAVLLASNNLSAWLILLWSLSAGTQVTLFNGLPDAAADSFFILALPLLLRQKYWLAAIPMSLSVLSREAFLLFPAMLGLVIAINHVQERLRTGTPIAQSTVSIFMIGRLYAIAVPVVLFVLWQAYILLHFGVSPRSQAQGILDIPFRSWFDYVMTGISGTHPLTGTAYGSRIEALLLTVFAAVLIATFYTSVKTLLQANTDIPKMGLAIGCIVMAMLYLCFGPTVMMHYTGYYKAIGIFIFLLPLLALFANVGKWLKTFLYLFLVVQVVVTSIYNFRIRFSPDGGSFDKYTHISQISGSNTKTNACFDEPRVMIDVGQIAVHNTDILGKIFGVPHLTVDLSVTNTSKYTYRSYFGEGSVFISYHWLDASGRVVEDGIRSALVSPLAPGETAAATVVSPLPPASAKLVLSPVQEGCAWFYTKDGAVSLTYQ